MIHPSPSGWSAPKSVTRSRASVGPLRWVIAGLFFASMLVTGAGPRATPAQADDLPPILHPLLGSTPSTLLAAGDIAYCDSSGDEKTAALLDGLDGTVATLGDNAYGSGTKEEFTNCYEPSWGRHKARTRPAPGNHDYVTSGAAGYFAYFGAAAGPSGRGYYSYDLGNWHIVSLNSNIDMAEGSAQEKWLRRDLKDQPAACTLAYWHHARFSSGPNNGDTEGTQPLWQALYDAHADVVLVGHDHHYERFAPMDAAGRLDPQAGIREFVVGTGGAGLYKLDDAKPKPNSEVRDDDTHGVLELTLYADRYEWRFVHVVGQSFTDAGEDLCH